tara:strand:- start:55 stop:312 length:258 start_codon:yes stop_codon:yes gene_type:complete
MSEITDKQLKNVKKWLKKFRERQKKEHPEYYTPEMEEFTKELVQEILEIEKKKKEREAIISLLIYFTLIVILPILVVIYVKYFNQ